MQNKTPILDRLRLMASGRTFVATPEMEFHTVIRDAMDKIRELVIDREILLGEVNTLRDELASADDHITQLLADGISADNE